MIISSTSRLILTIFLSSIFFLSLTSCKSVPDPSPNEFHFLQNWDKNDVRLVPPKFDERKFVIAHLSVVKKIDVLFMGSSRIMEVNSDLFREDVNMFNSSISVGVIQDFAAIWQSIKNQAKVPGYFIISLDPWVFNKNNRRNEWRSNQKLYDQFLNHVKISKWEMWKSSLFSFQKKPNDWSVVPESEMQSTQRGKRGDGSFVFERPIPRSDQDRYVLGQAQKYLQGCIFSICDWEFDENQYQVLVQLLQEIQSQGAKVLLILPPYHPFVYNKLYQATDSYRGILPGVEQTLSIRLKNEPGVAFDFCNVLNPVTVGCRLDEFTDGMHYQQSCAEKMIKFCAGKFIDGLLL